MFTWNGRQWSSGQQGQFQKTLAARGVNYQTWAQRHPGAAGQLSGRPVAPAGQPARPSVPGTPAPSQVVNSPVPGANIYGAQWLEAQKAYDDAVASLNASRKNTYLDYGFKADGSGLDANNPYGVFQRANQAQARNLDSMQEQTALRGLVGSGIAGGEERDQRFTHQMDDLQMSRDYQGDIAQIAGAERKLRGEYEAAKENALRTAVDSAIDGRLFNPAAPAAKPGAKPAAAKGTVSWGGKNMTRAQLARFLATRGSNINTWAKRHPAAARNLGM